MEYPKRYHPMEGTKEFLIWGVFYSLSCQEGILEEKKLENLYSILRLFPCYFNQMYYNKG